jgi:hypothetical protein
MSGVHQELGDASNGSNGPFGAGGSRANDPLAIANLSNGEQPVSPAFPVDAIASQWKKLGDCILSTDEANPLRRFTPGIHTVEKCAADIDGRRPTREELLSMSIQYFCEVGIKDELENSICKAGMSLKRGAAGLGKLYEFGSIANFGATCEMHLKPDPGLRPNARPATRPATQPDTTSVKMTVKQIMEETGLTQQVIAKARKGNMVAERWPGSLMLNFHNCPTGTEMAPVNQLICNDHLKISTAKANEYKAVFDEFSKYIETNCPLLWLVLSGTGQLRILYDETEKAQAVVECKELRRYIDFHVGRQQGVSSDDGSANDSSSSEEESEEGGGEVVRLREALLELQAENEDLRKRADEEAEAKAAALAEEAKEAEMKWAGDSSSSSDSGDGAEQQPPQRAAAVKAEEARRQQQQQQEEQEAKEDGGGGGEGAGDEMEVEEAQEGGEEPLSVEARMKSRCLRFKDMTNAFDYVKVIHAMNTHMDDEVVREVGTDILWQWTDVVGGYCGEKEISSEDIMAFCSVGAVECLVRAMKASVDADPDDVPGLQCSVFRVIGFEDEVARRAGGAGAVECIVSFLPKHIDDEEDVQACLRPLEAFVSGWYANQKRAVAAGAVGLLERVLKIHPDNEDVKDIARCTLELLLQHVGVEKATAPKSDELLAREGKQEEEGGAMDEGK